MMSDYPESIEFGKKSEDSFMYLFAKKNGIPCKPSTEFQNKVEHIDCICGNWSFDVKGQRKKKRIHDDFCNDQILLEIKGVAGFDGWLYGNAEYIAWETSDSFFIFRRQDLVNHYEANEHLYEKITRPNKKDLFVWVPFEHLITTKFSILPKKQPMSNYTPQPNTFSLFANDKGDNPKRPDYKGDIIMPDGTKMRLSAWVRESANGGKKFLSGKVEPMQDQQKSAPAVQAEGDDLPF